MNDNKNNKKVLIGSLVAVITLVIAVVGATYAFFSLNVSGDATNTNVDIETGNADVVSIKQGVNNMHINLSVSDMAKDSSNKEYYATDTEDNYKLTEEDGTLTFATVTGTNKEASDCTAKVTITMDTSTNSMGKALQKGDTELYITSGKTEETVDLYDLLTEELPESVTKEIEIELSVSESAEASITGYLKVNNTESDQSYLSGKTLNITITVDNLVCGVSKGNALEVLSLNPDLESNEHMTSRNDTLRRFQGQAEVSGNKIINDVNNYVCFGIKTKEICKSDTDKYLYRIIGIDTETNELKIIKREALNYSYQWNSSYNDDTKWSESDLQKNLNSSYFLTNTKDFPYMQDDINVDSYWTKIISPHDWEYGDVLRDDSGFNENTTSLQAYQNEKNAWNNTLNAKIGLMYTSDYYLSGVDSSVNNESDLKCYYNSFVESYYGQCKKSWLYLINNDSSNLSTSGESPAASYEWNMSRSTNSSAWLIHYDGYITVGLLTNAYAVRPVFYLSSDINIIEGDGSLNNPYIISGQESSAAETIIANSKGLESEKHMNLRNDNIRRFQGQVETRGSYIANDINNYICFGTNVENECINDTDKYLYRIIGIDTNNNELKIIKREALNTSYIWNASSGATWNDADLQKNLNGSYFLTNTSEYPYMQNDKETENKWTKLISSHNWGYGNVPSGDDSGFNKTMKGTQAFQNEKDLWNNTLKNVKIGLMYASDYWLSGTTSIEEDDLRCGDDSRSDVYCKNSWLNFLNNDSAELSTSGEEPPDQFYEWTMSQHNISGSYAIYNDGRLIVNSQTSYNDMVRPVFYLSNKIKLSGKGTRDHPYVITNV